MQPTNIVEIFWRQILRQQEPIILRDIRLMAEWLAFGKYAMVMGARTEPVYEAVKAGAPISVIHVEGVNYVSGSLIALVKNVPHPNAAKVFLNWLLSREGQEIYSKYTGKQSARLDIKVEGLDGIREPGIDYIMTHHEDYVKSEKKLMMEGREVFEPFLK